MHLLPEQATRYAVSIPELLVSRDERQARQHAWLTRHLTPLVSFTVVAPGPIKDSELTRRIFNHGVTALLAVAKKQAGLSGSRLHWPQPVGRKGSSPLRLRPAISSSPRSSLSISIRWDVYGISMC